MFLFWLPLLAFGRDIFWANGRDDGSLTIGSAVNTDVVVSVYLKAALENTIWLSLLAIGGSVLEWFFFLAVNK
jgi:phospholipid-transporting ATPase